MGSEMINIKGTKKGLVILLDSNKDFNELKSRLKEKIISSRGFFKGARFTFKLDETILDLDKEKELEAICCEHGLIRSEEEIPHSQQISKLAKSANHTKDTNDTEETEETEDTKVSTQPEKGSLLLTSGLRSGQKVNYDGNITILGDVNYGSEIVASGDIVVMGTLRGIAHAGASGNGKALIVAYRLKASQIRIGSQIGCSPDEVSDKSRGPEVAFISDGKINIQKYVPNKLKLVM